MACKPRLRNKLPDLSASVGVFEQEQLERPFCNKGIDATQAQAVDVRVNIFYLKSQRLARIATASEAIQPDVAPVGFDFDGFTFPVAKMDFREGGTSLVRMRAPRGMKRREESSFGLFLLIRFRQSSNVNLFHLKHRLHHSSRFLRVVVLQHLS